MGRALLVLHTDEIRAKAIDWIRRAPKDSRVEFKGPARTLDQNAKFHAAATEVSLQVEWHGAMRSVDNWKRIFVDHLDRQLMHEAELVPSIDGDGYVRLNRSTTDLSIDEMSMLIELVHQFGANHGVIFHEPEDGPRPARKRKGKDDG